MTKPKPKKKAVKDADIKKPVRYRKTKAQQAKDRQSARDGAGWASFE